MTDYYVKSYANGGRDSHTGESHEQAWETIAKVNGFSFNTGDCVYFLCGDTWNNVNLIMDLSGTNDSNRAILGAYYMDGIETVGVNEDGKPVLDSGWNTSLPFQITVMFSGAHYVKVQDLKLYNSHAFGIAGTYDAVSSNISLLRLEIDYTGRGGIVFTGAVGTNGLIEYCNVGRSDLRHGAGTLGTWDSGIAYNSDNGTIRYCEVHEAFGEGMAINSNNGLVENNLVWATRSVGIYVVGMTDGIVRNNVVLGVSDPTYHQAGTLGKRTWNGAGLGFNAEHVSNNTFRNKVYNNFVAGCCRGVQSLNDIELTIGTENRNFVYGNTFIDNYFNIWTDSNVIHEMDTEYKNNISYLTTEGIAQGGHHVFYKQHVGTTDVYRPLGNFWSSAPEYSEWEHASDVVGDPKFARTSGWLSISEPSDINIAADIALLAGSDAIDVALNLGDTYDEAFIEGCDFNTPDASNVATPIIVVTGDQDSYGTGWDFGARIFTGTVIRGAAMLALM